MAYCLRLRLIPSTAIPKKAKLGITTTSTAGLIGTVFAPGRKISQSTETYRFGYIEDKGGPVLGVPGIETGGSELWKCTY